MTSLNFPILCGSSKISIIYWNVTKSFIATFRCLNEVWTNIPVMRDTSNPSEVQVRYVPNHDIIITIWLSVGGFVVGYDMMTLPGFFPVLKRHIIISYELQSFYTGIFSVGALLSSVPTAYLNDRFGRKKTLLFSCITSVIGNIILATGFLSISVIVSRCITGLSIGEKDSCL